jgi:hypothetical protein|tara:strand:+ start:133 stop:801 length:669 start_codon:yes stop_codon:yes gene_type:complete
MNGFISLNQLAYGQATIEERIAIDSGTQFEKHVKVFQNDPYPENVSPEAKQELYEIVTKVDKLTDEEWRRRCFFIDRQLGKYLNGFAQKAGITQFKSIFDQVNHLYLNSLIYQTKYYYNRLRPNQLAYYLKIGLTSASTRTGHTPSYPSGHTLQTHFYTKLISDVMNIPWSDEPTREVAASRMSMGIHYKTDNDFAIKISEYLLDTDEYRELVENIRKELNV